MKKILFATAATIALTLPAMAQSQMQTPKDQAQHDQMNKSNMDQSKSNMDHMNNNNQSQQSSQGTAQSGQQANRQANEMIEPSQLSEKQVSEIQQALNQKGFDAGNVDGIWGDETRAALRNFQQKQGMSESSQLDSQTLAALGVQWQQQELQTRQTSGGGSQNGMSGNANQSGMSGGTNQNGMSKPAEGK